MRTREILIAGLALLGGCSSIFGSEDDKLGTGEYSVLMRVRPGGTPEAYAFVGTVRLTFATDDSVAGQWNIPGFEPALRAGAWDGDAYRLGARVSSTPWTADLRVSRDGRSCRGLIIFPFPGVEAGVDTAPSLECRIVAGPPPADFPVLTTIAFTPPQGTYRIACSVFLRLALRDQYGALIVPGPIAFSSSNPSVARVSADRTMIECLSPGQATLTAAAGGKSGSALITVLGLFDPLPAVATPGASVRH